MSVFVYIFSPQRWQEWDDMGFFFFIYYRSYLSKKKSNVRLWVLRLIDRINAHSRGSAISAVFTTVYRRNLSVASKCLALEVNTGAGVRHMSLNSLHGLRACTAAMITHLTNTEKCQPRALSHVISCVRGRIASPCRFRGLKTYSKRQRSCNQFG